MTAGGGRQQALGTPGATGYSPRPHKQLCRRRGLRASFIQTGKHCGPRQVQAPEEQTRKINASRKEAHTPLT